MKNILKIFKFIVLLCFTTQISISISCDFHTIFAHGIIDGPQQIHRFQKAIASPYFTAITFPDAQINNSWGVDGCIGKICAYFGKKVNRTAMFMGQKKDIEAIHATFSTIPDNSKIIAYGCSRGAAALITYQGLYNPENIAALILDASPADIAETIAPKITGYGIHPSYAPKIFSFLFPQYDYKTAITPLQAIKLIKNKKLPILLIHSQQDTVVDYTHSLRLYLEFIDHGFSNVHIALLTTGRHSFLLQNELIQQKYLNIVHDFYKYYKLPYDKEYCTNSLLSTFINYQESQAHVDTYKSKLMHTYNKANNINTTILLSLISAFFAYHYASKVK